MLARIDKHSLLQAVYTTVKINQESDHCLPVSNFVDENVSTKVVKIIQYYTGIVNRMVCRKL